MGIRFDVQRSATEINIYENPVTYAISGLDQNIIANTLNADAFLVQKLPGLNLQFELFLRWTNPTNGGGLQFNLTVDSASLFFFEDIDGNEYASGDTIQLTGDFGNRLEYFCGSINTTGCTLTLNRGLVTQVSTPTIIKRNSMFVFTH